MLREAAGSGSYRIDLSAVTDTNELLGRYTMDSGGTAHWQPGILARPMEEGKPVILENLETAPRETLQMLEMLHKHGRIPLAGKGINSEGKLDHVASREGFQVLATMNPSGYAGRKAVPNSIREIFSSIVTI